MRDFVNYCFLLNLTFICPCIGSISLKNNQQDAALSRSIYFYKLLYIFQAVPPSIVRSIKLYIQRQALSNQYCCLLLSWMRWNETLEVCFLLLVSIICVVLSDSIGKVYKILHYAQEGGSLTDLFLLTKWLWKVKLSSSSFSQNTITYMYRGVERTYF